MYEYKKPKVYINEDKNRITCTCICLPQNFYGGLILQIRVSATLHGINESGVCLMVACPGIVECGAYHH